MASRSGIATLLRQHATTRQDGVEDLVERFWRHNAGYSLERVVTFPPAHNTFASAGRLRMLLNVGDPAGSEPASSSTIELWKPEGWLLVDSMPGAIFLPKVPASTNTDDLACAAAARDVQNEQLVDALVILG